MTLITEKENDTTYVKRRTQTIELITYLTQWRTLTKKGKMKSDIQSAHGVGGPRLGLIYSDESRLVLSI